MKKKLLLLLVPLLIGGLSGCVKYNGQGKPGKGSKATSSEVQPASSDAGQAGSSDAGQQGSSDAGQSSSITPPDPSHHETEDDAQEGETVTIYLVFGQYGKYDGEFVNTKEEALFLEHTKKVTDAVVGSDLPGKDKVTSSVEGSVFQTWVMYKNDGKLTEYTKVPAIKGAILYASFSGGQGGGQSSGGSTLPTTYTPSSATETAAAGFGFKFSDNTYMVGQYAEEFDGFKQYKLTARSFKKDQTFTLWDFGYNNGWVVNVDPYSFNGSSAQDTSWQKYLSNDGSKYTVLQNFNAAEIYIKIKEGQDQVYFKLGIQDN